MRDPLTPAQVYVDHAAARRIIVGVLLAMLLAALDQVMVATALPTIAASFADVDNMSWVVTANLLCATAVTPLYGKLSDIHGRRTMMLIAISVYGVGSLACALAPSMLTLILARALQGLGGGGLMPLVQTIIGDVASPRDRPRYQAYTSSTFIVSTVGGPISAASSPSICTGRGFSGSTCRSAASPIFSPTTCCERCRDMTVRTSSTCWALCSWSVPPSR